jgi:hypothetical protein
MAQGFSYQFELVQTANAADDVGRVGALAFIRLEQSTLLEMLQQGLK